MKNKKTKSGTANYCKKLSTRLSKEINEPIGVVYDFISKRFIPFKINEYSNQLRIKN